MQQVLKYVAAFLLGVVCTVLVYEVVRVATNAREALDAASSQLAAADEEPVVVKRPPVRPVPKGVKGESAELAAKRALLEANGQGPAAEAARKERERRLQRIKERRQRRWNALTPEEQKRRREIRDARKPRLGTAPAGKGGAPAFRSLEPKDEPILDTGVK
ncbi:MAG: hypothetical protein R3F61_08590 [Myxococcota bacterium]